ncbi:MAG: hypothetical protein RLZZ602_1334 [Pseudomonadota bacterium]|jgi:hypothetical protein
MKECWLCNGPLIWGGDIDIDDNEHYAVETNLSCKDCEALVLVYWPRNEDDDQTDTR